MLRLSRSLSRFETQDIKTQPMNQPIYLPPPFRRETVESLAGYGLMSKSFFPAVRPETCDNPAKEAAVAKKLPVIRDREVPSTRKEGRRAEEHASSVVART